MDQFDAPQDRFVQATTVLTVIVFSVLFLIFASSDNSQGLVLVVIIGIPLLVLCYVFAPSGYSVTESDILIHRKVGSVRVPLSSVTSVEQDPVACPFWGVRTYGVSGLFGYFGRFNNKHLGPHRMYVTDRSKAVVIKANNTYVISPDDPQQFIQIAKARMELKRSE
jgi:hypothetical protein